MTKTFATFTEENDWEGETWRWYIPIAGNEEALSALTVLVERANMAGAFHLDLTPIPESEVDTLIKHREVGYLYSHERLHGRLVVPEVTEDFADVLYKGGVQRMMQAEASK